MNKLNRLTWLKKPSQLRSDARQALADALRHPRYEIFPLAGIDDLVAKHVARDATVTVTSSPTRGMAGTLDLVDRLSDLGYAVVPHLSARLIADEVELKDILDRLDAHGVRDVFAVGGDPDEPAGAFAESYDLLVAMDGLSHNLVEVGIAGYPESHPKIHDDITIQAMWDKRRYATYIVSQICFDPKVTAAWVERVRRRGVTLPIRIGVPGPAAAGRLLRTSTRIGVGESTRFLTKHGPGLLRLARPGTYTPDRLLDRLAPAMARPDNRVDGLHIYTFNDVASAEKWRRTRLAQLQED